VVKYNQDCGGNLQTICAFDVTTEDNPDSIKKKLEMYLKNQVRLIYIWGCAGDLLTRDKRIDQIGMAMETACKAGMICGIGGHSSSVVVECEKQGLKPAFYVKTFHHDQYWSATPKETRKNYCWYPNNGAKYSYTGATQDHNEYQDNMWCLDPEQTSEIMKKVTVPWVGFKVLAAGAINPTSGFKYAIQNGADFIAVGMLDYQVEEDINIFKGLFARGIERERPWRG
jgi:hypothetical protein